MPVMRSSIRVMPPMSSSSSGRTRTWASRSGIGKGSSERASRAGKRSESNRFVAAGGSSAAPCGSAAPQVRRNEKGGERVPALRLLPDCELVAEHGQLLLAGPCRRLDLIEVEAGLYLVASFVAAVYY